MELPFVYTFFDRRQFDKFFVKNILTRVIFTEFSSSAAAKLRFVYFITKSVLTQKIQGNLTKK